MTRLVAQRIVDENGVEWIWLVTRVRLEKKARSEILAITLPKDLCKEMGIDRGTIVEVFIRKISVETPQSESGDSQ